MADYAWKAGDTEPLEVYLNSSHANPWTLDGSVVVNIRKQGSTTPIVTRATCEIVDATTHKVRFRPTAAQTGHSPGLYNVEFENTAADGTVRTFPSGLGDEPDYFEVEVVAQIA